MSRIISGVRKTVVWTLIVAPATSYVAYNLTPGKTAIVKKIMWANRNVANGKLQIGETIAAAWVQRLPEIDMIAGMGDTLTEREIPNFEFQSNVVVRATIGAADPNDIRVMIEVDER